MIEQENLPKPQIDLPLPEKEIQASFDNKASFLNSKWLKIGIVVAVLVLVMGGVYTLGRNSVFKELNPTTPAIPSPAPVVYEPTPTADSTADWKTYINTKHNYSFKYPRAYSLLKGPGENIPDEEFQKIDSVDFGDEGRISISVNPDIGNKKMECLSNEDCLNKRMAILKRTENNSKYVFKTIAGKNIKGLEYNISELNQTFQDFIFINYGKIWVISFTDKKITNTFDQILSTFKFTQ